MTQRKLNYFLLIQLTKSIKETMRKIFLLLGVVATQYCLAQVGISTENPKATLDVAASPGTTKIDGVIAPRLEGNELKAKDALYTAEQTGAIVYILSASSDAGTDNAKTTNVDAVGYYYYDGTVWVKVGAGAPGASGVYKEPWYNVATNKPATDNTQNIYQMANVGINTMSPEKNLDVAGNFRTRTTNDNGIWNILETNSTLIPDATLLITADHEDISQMKKYASYIVQPSSVSTSVADSDSGQNTESFMTPSTGMFYSYNNEAQGRLDLLAGFASLSTSNNSSGFQSDISVSPSSAGLIVQQPSTGQSAIFGVNTRMLYFQFNESATNIKGAYYFPSNYGKRGQVLTTHGAPNDPGNGGQANILTWRDVGDLIILKAPNGSCYKLTVDNSGNLATTPDADCNVDPYNPSAFSRMAGTGDDFSKVSENNISNMLEERKKVLEEQNKAFEKLKPKIKKL